MSSCEYYCNRRHHSLVVKIRMKHISSRAPYLSSRKAANSASLLSPYKSHSFLHLWNDTPIFILVFSLALSNSFFLYCFSLSVFLFLLFDVGNGGAFFSTVVVVCSLPLFTVWGWTYLTRWEQTLHLCGGGALPSTCCMRERGCQQRMHPSEWHFSDTLLGSDWLYLAGSGGFLWIKPQPLGGASDTAYLYFILLTDHNDNFSKYYKNIYRLQI